MTLNWLGQLLTGLFVLAICLGVARVLFLTAAGLGNRRAEQRRVPPQLPEPPPLQTVLIPAYNEGKVIAGAVRHILASDYPNLEVIVIDDGSADDTSEQVRIAFRGRSSRQAHFRPQWRQGCGSQYRPEAGARAMSSWRSTPTRISRRTRSRGSCAGSRIKRRRRCR